MTFAEIQAEIRRRVRESTDSGIFFSTEDIKEAANAGYMELSDATEWCEDAREIDLLKDRPYYDLFTLIGAFFLSIKPAFDEETSRWLVPSTVRALDGNDRRWERVVGRPVRLFMRGLRWLGLYPRVNADGTTIKVYFTRLPEMLCDDDDEPGFPEAFHDGIVEFALADLFAQDGETGHAVAAWKEYLTVEARLQQWVDGRLQRPLTRVLGGAR